MCSCDNIKDEELSDDFLIGKWYFYHISPIEPSDSYIGSIEYFDKNNPEPGFVYWTFTKDEGGNYTVKIDGLTLVIPDGMSSFEFDKKVNIENDYKDFEVWKTSTRKAEIVNNKLIFDKEGPNPREYMIDYIKKDEMKLHFIYFQAFDENNILRTDTMHIVLRR